MRGEYQAFENAEEVWFWFCACLQARDGVRSRSDYAGVPRPCEVADISCIIKQLHYERRLSNRHLRVMYRWGAVHCAPYADRRSKRSEIRLWCESMQELEAVFRNKRIIEEDCCAY